VAKTLVPSDIEAVLLVDEVNTQRLIVQGPLTGKDKPRFVGAGAPVAEATDIIFTEVKPSLKELEEAEIAPTVEPPAIRFRPSIVVSVVVPEFIGQFVVSLPKSQTWFCALEVNAINSIVITNSNFFFIIVSFGWLWFFIKL
jgi:hypothetical protein